MAINEKEWNAIAETAEQIGWSARYSEGYGHQFSIQVDPTKKTVFYIEGDCPEALVANLKTEIKEFSIKRYIAEWIEQKMAEGEPMNMSVQGLIDKAKDLSMRLNALCSALENATF